MGIEWSARVGPGRRVRAVRAAVSERVGARVAGVVVGMAVVLLVGLSGCDDGDHPDGWVFLGPTPKELEGVWTGEALIAATTSDGTVVDRDGFRFPVSLDLHANQHFVLRTFGFPVSGHPEDRTCAGIFRVTSQQLEFFPNTSCRALPVSRFTIGSFAPNGLTLRSEPWDPSFGTFVKIQVERSFGKKKHR